VGVQDVFLSPSGVHLGVRRCPNNQCHAAVFVVHLADGSLRHSYPPELVDFDASNLPPAVLKALEEAIQSHANECYTASAIMIRKTLEEMCKDRDAKGANLKERIEDLGTKIVLPKELLDGLDDLRLLGNDAAHVEATVYDDIGQEEVEVGIDFTKEVLKAVYQYAALLERLQALKRSPAA
jgi:hypothetical protein